MKPNFSTDCKRGFTLMETVIAIGVLSVLLTGFMIVFIPAADGIKKSISIQETDRLVAALEHELTNLRTGNAPQFIEDYDDEKNYTGFDKAFWAIWKSTGTTAPTDEGIPDNALLVYQYRGKNPNHPDLEDENKAPRTDGSLAPMAKIQGKAGDTYTLVPMMRRKSDSFFLADLPAIEGSVYLVKCVQLVYKNDDLSPTDTRGTIINPQPNSDPAGPFDNAAAYPDAVIAFAAEFYPVPSKAKGFIEGTGFTDFYKRSVKPSFTRNLAIRR